MTKSPRELLFMAWGWLAVPWALSSAAVAFSVDPYFGLGVAALIGVWFLDMGETTCSRCGSYGTGRCGLQSWLVPLFWARKSIRGVSRFRVRLHFYFDLLAMAVGVATFAFVPVVLPFFLAWLALGWFVVFGPGANHGLLPLLRVVPDQVNTGRFSLHVIPAAASVPTGRATEAEPHAAADRGLISE